eukprot:2380136-Prymnesium_polylepis.1
MLASVWLCCRGRVTAINGMVAWKRAEVEAIEQRTEGCSPGCGTLRPSRAQSHAAPHHLRRRTRAGGACRPHTWHARKASAGPPGSPAAATRRMKAQSCHPRARPTRRVQQCFGRRSAHAAEPPEPPEPCDAPRRVLCPLLCPCRWSTPACAA